MDELNVNLVNLDEIKIDEEQLNIYVLSAAQVERHRCCQCCHICKKISRGKNLQSRGAYRHLAASDE